jgi:endogenous inhibitor of DNA gyrase (YacG/DUF329 family)
MKCPNCKRTITFVHVYSQCRQKADIDKKGNITDYGGVEEIFETLKVECPECYEELVVKE